MVQYYKELFGVFEKSVGSEVNEGEVMRRHRSRGHCQLAGVQISLKLACLALE